MSNEREWVTTTEAARALGISERALRSMIARGLLPAWRWGERARWRIARGDVARLLRKQRAESADIADFADSADI